MCQVLVLPSQDLEEDYEAADTLPMYANKEERPSSASAWKALERFAESAEASLRGWRQQCPRKGQSSAALITLFARDLTKPRAQETVTLEMKPPHKLLPQESRIHTYEGLGIMSFIFN